MTILGDQVLTLKLQIYSIFLWYTEVNLESLFFMKHEDLRKNKSSNLMKTWSHCLSYVLEKMPFDKKKNITEYVTNFKITC